MRTEKEIHNTLDKITVREAEIVAMGDIDPRTEHELSQLADYHEVLISHSEKDAEDWELERDELYDAMIEGDESKENCRKAIEWLIEMNDGDLFE